MDKHKPLFEYAKEIKANWPNVNYGAKPYLDAMHTLNQITDNYILDSGSSIVAYFLSNASSFKGEKARAIKKELNKILKESYKRG